MLRLAKPVTAFPCATSVPRRRIHQTSRPGGDEALKSGKSALLLGAEALSEPGLMLAGRIAAIGGVDLLCDTFFARMERGGGLPSTTKLPYFPDEA